MQENIKIQELTKEEIKKMLLISLEYDIYSTKCFAFLLLENNIEENTMKEIVDLLSLCKREDAKIVIEKM